MRAWVNGQVLNDADEPAIAATDHGFTVGDGVFETIKIIGDQPFAVTRHIKRLAHSAAGLGLTPPDPQTVRSAIAEILDGAGIESGRLRITFTPGPAPMGSERGTSRPTLAIIAAPAGPWEPTTSVVTVPWPRNERGPLVGLKTTSYADNVVALAEATKRGASEAIFANLAGNLCEGTGSNIFYVVDDELRTPTLAAGCLAGITRALVIEWFGAREVDEPIEVLQRAAEVFLTSSTRDIHPVHAVNERHYAAPGPITENALQAWSERSADQVDP